MSKTSSVDPRCVTISLRGSDVSQFPPPAVALSVFVHELQKFLPISRRAIRRIREKPPSTAAPRQRRHEARDRRGHPGLVQHVAREDEIERPLVRGHRVPVERLRVAQPRRFFVAAAAAAARRRPSPCNAHVEAVKLRAQQATLQRERLAVVEHHLPRAAHRRRDPREPEPAPQIARVLPRHRCRRPRGRAPPGRSQASRVALRGGGDAARERDGRRPQRGPVRIAIEQA